MPSIEWNRQLWGKNYTWPADGDEWSYSFGSAAAHWFAFILPRLHRYLPDSGTPGSRIVEIAPGHGRWTQFLLNHCNTLAGYDVGEECISFCKNRFSDRVNNGTAEFGLTDGLSIPEKDHSIDLVFSFDSLVHVERDVMKSYLVHIGRCLKPGRFAFLQHSNLGAYPHLHHSNNGGPFNSRGVTVSAETVQADAKEQGLATLIQEGLNHETQRMRNEMVDCISVIQKPPHHHAVANTVFLNNQFYSTMGTIAKDYVLPYETCGMK